MGICTHKYKKDWLSATSMQRTVLLHCHPTARRNKSSEAPGFLSCIAFAESMQHCLNIC